MKKPRAFARETLERATELLRAAPADGLDAQQLATALGLSFVTGRQLCGVLGVALPHRGKWRKGELSRYRLHDDAETLIGAHTALEAAGEKKATVRHHVEGMCLDCTCKLTDSDFVMIEGRPVLPQCPKRPAMSQGFFRRHVQTPALREPSRMTPAQRHRRAVQLAVRASEAPLTMAQLGRATGLPTLELSAVMTTMLHRGELVKLIRTRPGQSGIAIYTVPGAVPDPLRAS